MHMIIHSNFSLGIFIQYYSSWSFRHYIVFTEYSQTYWVCVLFDQNKLTILCTIAQLAVVILEIKYDAALNSIIRKHSSKQTCTYLGDSPPHVSSLPWIHQLQPHRPLFVEVPKIFCFYNMHFPWCDEEWSTLTGITS
jgi:hypothetical protein